MPNIQQGYLILADISGYTSCLAGTELDHSQAILTELLGRNQHAGGGAV